MKTLENMKYLLVDAEVRYWEDSYINDEEDTNGTLIPFRNGLSWCPVIRLKDGFVEGWPRGTSAEIHYKVTDQGLYYLSDNKSDKVFQWIDSYVPDEFLCIGENGFGDYIVMFINENGFIEDWHCPDMLEKDWEMIV